MDGNMLRCWFRCPHCNEREEFLFGSIISDVIVAEKHPAILIGYCSHCGGFCRLEISLRVLDKEESSQATQRGEKEIINLCESCVHSFPECKGSPQFAIDFTHLKAEGKDADAVVDCDMYEEA